MAVRRRFQLMCVATTLRGVTRAAFLQAVGPQAAARILFNPYEAAPC